jgi:hypothetical protein
MRRSDRSEAERPRGSARRRVPYPNEEQRKKEEEDEKMRDKVERSER